MAYFSNGSEGQILSEQCADCRIGDECCPVAAVQLEYNYDACNVPVARAILAGLVNEDGICQLKPLVDALAVTA